MSVLFGELECKVDAKGRFLFPAALLKQLPDEQRNDFVINQGLDGNLDIYPKESWVAALGKIMAKNQYVAQNRAFTRRFQSGAAPVTLDSAKRLNIPKALMDRAGIANDVVLIGAGDRIECWAKDRYDAWLTAEGNQLEDLAEAVMGDHE
jgi:MraZ protein